MVRAPPLDGRDAMVHVMPEPRLQRQVKVTSIPTPVASPGGTELTSVRFCIGKPANYTAYSDQGATKQQFKVKMTRFGKKIKQKKCTSTAQNIIGDVETLDGQIRSIGF